MPLTPAYRVEGFCGSISRVSIYISGSPAFAVFQLPPPFVLLKIPPPEVAAYRVDGLTGSITRARIPVLVSPELIADQLLPLSVLFKMPVDVPAYITDVLTGSITRAVIRVEPACNVSQLLPPLTLLKTPAPSVPAYRIEGFSGLTASAVGLILGSP